MKRWLADIWEEIRWTWREEPVFCWSLLLSAVSLCISAVALIIRTAR